NRGAQNGFPRRSATQADQSALAREQPSVRGDQVCGKTDLAPAVGLVLLAFERGADQDLRRYALAIIRLGGRQGLTGVVFRSRRTGLRPPEGRIETPVAQRVHKARINS